LTDVAEARLDFSPGLSYFFGQLGKAFLAPGSHISLLSLASALLTALIVLAVRQLRKGRRVRPRALLRALFPRRIVMSRSTLADASYFYFNLFLFGIIFGWAVLSYEVVSHRVTALLAAFLGPTEPSALPLFVTKAAVTVMLFVAYELGYWLNHYLSHRIPFLWEFHKVHHSATVLSPLTNFRVHPVYMCVFLNILALFVGLANGVGDYIFGQATSQYGLSETNLILVFFIYLYVHLQHSELWIAFSGGLGRLLMSPAHHQIHHSRDPDHFNKNLGSCLALWDWIFGTLYVPGPEPEKLEFGVEPDRPYAHTIRGELLAPFGQAALLLKRAVGRRAPSISLPVPGQKSA
jgi:sterol desaturase/sphingolipid hydroxylase (fatty acid hydroxylase superfamily)